MLLDKLKNFNIILASASPRRKQLLGEMGFVFSTMPKDVDESYPDGLSPIEVAEYLSRLKADAFETAEMEIQDLVITADTVVTLDEAILGKPANKDEAFEMLNLLSGKTHEVITAVTLKSKSKLRTFSSVTSVTFKTLSKYETDFYIKQFKPYDKAGAYGIQEWIGYVAIERIDGSYFNVVGLPTHQLYEELTKFV